MPDLGVHDGPIWVFTITGMRTLRNRSPDLSNRAVIAAANSSGDHAR